MANKQVEISMAEWDVMNIIWDKKSVSANEIVVEIQKNKEVSDKTIRTLITVWRGHEKFSAEFCEK